MTDAVLCVVRSSAWKSIITTSSSQLLSFCFARQRRHHRGRRRGCVMTSSPSHSASSASDSEHVSAEAMEAGWQSVSGNKAVSGRDKSGWSASGAWSGKTNFLSSCLGLCDIASGIAGGAAESGGCRNWRAAISPLTAQQTCSGHGLPTTHETRADVDSRH